MEFKTNSEHLSKITRLLYNVSLTEVRLDQTKWNEIIIIKSDKRNKIEFVYLNADNYVIKYE